MSELTFRHETLILDASPLICLYASGQMENILSSIPKTVTVAAYVKSIEVKHIYNQPVKGVEQPTEPIDLQPIIDKGLLKVVNLEVEDEALTVIDLIMLVGQGEAYTGAIANHRGWAIGIDDRKARRIFSSNMPHLQLVSTLDLVKHWGTVTNTTEVVMQLALKNIRDRARYRPDNNHPHFAWWKELAQPETDE